MACKYADADPPFDDQRPIYWCEAYVLDDVINEWERADDESDVLAVVRRLKDAAEAYIMRAHRDAVEADCG